VAHVDRMLRHLASFRPCSVGCVSVAGIRVGEHGSRLPTNDESWIDRVVGGVTDDCLVIKTPSLPKSVVILVYG